ncbi:MULTISPECIES: hypothetical protein [unclassified Achromobacter]|uniref:hypothetical protein n=1 Tax=unclassified Achromobacter TaxID=2626865 RepID=UPI00117776E3|nr:MULTISPECIES: hypothetical protein [unclassified Achromobacter]
MSKTPGKSGKKGYATRDFILNSVYIRCNAEIAALCNCATVAQRFGLMSLLASEGLLMGEPPSPLFRAGAHMATAAFFNRGQEGVSFSDEKDPIAPFAPTGLFRAERKRGRREDEKWKCGKKQGKGEGDPLSLPSSLPSRLSRSLDKNYAGIDAA